MKVGRYFRVEAVGTQGGAAAVYVPLVVASRALAFVRLLVVARLLGAEGKVEFGLYQPAQEMVNFVVPVVLFGLSDVAERYASRFEREGRLGAWLKGHYLRLGLGIGGAVLLMCAGAGWIARGVLHVSEGEMRRGVWLVVGCAVTVGVLAVYQHLAAILRGVRAYGASAGMELSSAVLFLAFATLAAWRGGAVSLICAYAASVILPVAFYGVGLWRFLHRAEGAGGPGPVIAGPDRGEEPGELRLGGFHGFAIWAFVRLLLMMAFGAVSVLAVGGLAGGGKAGQEATADYAMPYRVAQLLAYVAATVWASSYGIAARAWSHGQVRRAEVQWFRVGKWGGVALMVIALALLVGRDVLGLIERDYAVSLGALLPPLLGVFIWYGLLVFCSLYGDLHERPQKGAAFWGAAVAVQLAVLMLSGGDAKERVVMACAWGVGASVLVLCPLVLWRPFRFSATGVPMAVLALAPVALFAPAWVVDEVAAPVMLLAIGFLWMAGLLVRPLDRRGWRRFRSRRAEPGKGSARSWLR